MPTTQRQRRDNSRPSGKTNATASGQANRPGTVAASIWYAQAAPTSCSEDLEGSRSAPSKRIQAMRLRQLEGDQEADDGRGQDRERQKRIDRERNPVLLLGGNDLHDLQQADRSAASVASATPQARIRRPAHPDIIRLDVPRRNSASTEIGPRLAGLVATLRGGRAAHPPEEPPGLPEEADAVRDEEHEQDEDDPYATAGPPGFWVSSTIRSGRREPRSCPCAQNGMK